ncbi:MAG: hypothetical protein C0453_10115, partial [Comamonadaceae bacterium]|nr:hypothetical protein [Comamonadaceae bacterium]
MPATLAEVSSDSDTGHQEMIDAYEVDVDDVALAPTARENEINSPEASHLGADEADESIVSVDSVDSMHADVDSETEDVEQIAPEADDPASGEEVLSGSSTDNPGEGELDAVRDYVRVEIIVVDSVVADITDFIANRPGEIIYLDPNRDGVEQLAEALQGRTGIDAIHILSHGEAGALRLGSSVLTSQSMAGEHAEEMAVIAAALAPDADLLLYGCDVAVGTEGMAFVGRLAEVTGADVAATTDATGAAELGGNWTLEAQHGRIEADSLNITAWHGVLAQNNTGAWTVSGATASQSLNGSASTVAGGVTTTVSFSNFTNSTTNVTNIRNETLNNIAAFSPGLQNTASLAFLYNWDTTPEAGGASAASDGGTATITITFSQPVTDPILHLDRIGGSGGGVQNAMTFALQDSGYTLVRLAGTGHFAVDSTTGVISNSQVGQAVSGTFTGESSNTVNSGTAAGSVQVQGTNITSITFVMSFAPGGVEGAGGDEVELKVTLDPSPIARNDAFTMAEDTSLSGNLFANNGAGADSDFNNDPLTVTQVNGSPITQGVPVLLANGTLTITNASTGAFTFVPNRDYNGVQSFTYTIRDPNGGTSTATTTVTVTPVNDVPVAVADTIVVAEDNVATGSLAANDAPSGDGSNVWAVNTSPAHGTVTIDASTGNYVYTPVADYNGPDSFSYTLTDADGDVSIATVTVSVTPVQDTVADNLTTPEDTAITFNVLTGAGGASADNFEGTPQVTATSSPANGVIVVSADGTITYTPNANYNGPDSFTYTVTSPAGVTETETVNITVTPVNDAPVAADDAFTTLEDS